MDDYAKREAAYAGTQRSATAITRPGADQLERGRDNLHELLAAQRKALISLTENVTSVNGKLEPLSSREPRPTGKDAGLAEVDPYRIADHIRYHTQVILELDDLVRRIYRELDI